ncbi:hypothetical protein [Rhizobium sp. BK176]|uniref:hypothetical protein n=1 Tax=Rhizobium sp. BK176 TaxID=2587071 RepID=UPI00216A6A3D|nr:hypothetical protein [Rhizobium sp. BK176]MCS4088759.1 hypothetical protein [Rhizobium sp. BK176]
MKDVIWSPDELLLHWAEKAMRLAYNGFGVSPLAVQFWPALCTVAVSSVAFLAMSVTVDPTYLFVCGVCVLWTIRFWKNNGSLRTDAKKDWSADLFRAYAVKAASLRTETAWVRYLMLMTALVVTVVCCSDITAEIRALATWQRCVFPLDIWALVALAYSWSAEPPEPGDGDRLGFARRA